MISEQLYLPEDDCGLESLESYRIKDFIHSLINNFLFRRALGACHLDDTKMVADHIFEDLEARGSTAL